MIPDAAVEAALTALHPSWHDHASPAQWREIIRDLLEAGAPYMLSHEREETRLAHVDAVVNAETVDRLEKGIARAWDEGRKHGATYPYGERGLATDDNPYR